MENFEETEYFDTEEFFASLTPLAREFAYLPAVGEGAPFLGAQARVSQVDEAALTELISSIATHGMIQPVVVERTASGHRVLVGERRFRAFLYVVEHFPDNPHVQKGVPAIVLDGEYSASERRSAQIAENLVRANLTVSEMGVALLWVRCAILEAKIGELGYELPNEITEEKNAVTKWALLEAFRIEVEAHGVGAPWPEVIARLGIEVPPQRAQLLARAVSELPAGIGEEMDELRISLHSRIKWLNFARDYPEKAGELWEEVKSQERPDAFSAAITALKETPGGDPSDVVAAVSSAKDKGDQKASGEWLQSKAAAENAAASIAAEDEEDDGFGGASSSVPDDGRAPSAGKAVGVLRKLLKEIEGGFYLTPRNKEQLMILCSQVLAAMEVEFEDSEDIDDDDT